MPVRLFALLLLISVNLPAQTVRIDSLKNALAKLNGREKVNCLNSIGHEYLFYFIRADSGLKYTGQAYQLASGINYNSGKAVALILQGDIKGRLLDNGEIMKANCLSAIELLKKEDDPQNLSRAYYTLAIANNLQGDHEAGLENARIAKQISTLAGDKRGLGWAIEGTGLIYCHMGEYWKSFENMIESQQIGKEINDSFLTSISLSIIARCFNRVGDPQKALNYYHESLRYATAFLLIWPNVEDMSYAHLQLKNYDSVIYYQEKHRYNVRTLITEPAVLKKFAAFFWSNSVEVELAQRQYDAIIAEEIPLIAYLKKTQNTYPLMQALLVMGKTYLAKHQTTPAMKYARELMTTATSAANKPFLKEGNQLMASLFDELKRPDSAYFYFKNYINIKNGIDAFQFAQRTALYQAASEAESRIRLLKKDQKISEQQLALNKKELQKQGQLRNTLLISLAVLALLSALVIRNNILKRKNEHLRNEQDKLALKRKALELEMQALRAQMNPHFIFNCLSAIDNLMQTNQPDKATSYLARFANLIRAVLESSKNNLVPFRKDFETLRLYLEMEQFRCNNKFSYTLHAEPALMQGDYNVPPLIIQPFVENAIHHGLLNKPEANRQLQVTALLSDEYIVYSITDNGVGRKQAGILKEKNRPEHQSYGIAITRERIQLHNRNGMAHDIMITDLEQGGIASGTNAVIRINGMEN